MVFSTLLFVPRKTVARDLSFQVFYSSLSPYGEWVTTGSYGMCWRPNGVPIGWRPYTYGHWVWTDYGWTWVSDDPWGWAVFHYGRWAFDSQFGWVWAPDYVWAPAWVEWRWGSGYLGWAPMPPGFHFRVDVVVTGDDGDFGVAVGGWNFIRAEDIGRPRYSFVEREGVPRVMGSTRNVTKFRFTSRGVYSVGLPKEQVERATHKRIETVSVVRTTDVARERLVGNQFRVYSPAPLKPQVRSEQQQVERERVSQRRPSSGSYGQGEVQRAHPAQNNPRPATAPLRIRTRQRSTPAYHPDKSGQNQSRPRQESKQKEEKKGQDTCSRNDDGSGRWR